MALYPSDFSALTCEMRLGSASTTVTGTVTPASVKTRVMPHLRPTRPMVIVNPHNRGSDKRSATLQPVGGLDARDPRTLGPRPATIAGAHSLDNWRRRPRAPTSKLDGGVYRSSRAVQVFGAGEAVAGRCGRLAAGQPAF